MFKFLLYPASWLYKMAVLFRHQLFDWGILHSERFDIPVICIGNITVGGTGKTPMAEMVIAYMSQMHNVALLSRGYGRRTKGYLEVRADSHYRDAGAAANQTQVSRYGGRRLREAFRRYPPHLRRASRGRSDRYG